MIHAMGITRLYEIVLGHLSQPHESLRIRGSVPAEMTARVSLRQEWELSVVEGADGHFGPGEGSMC